MKPPNEANAGQWVAYLVTLPRWELDVMYNALISSSHDSSPINGFDEAQWLEIVKTARDKRTGETDAKL